MKFLHPACMCKRRDRRLAPRRLRTTNLKPEAPNQKPENTKQGRQRPDEPAETRLESLNSKDAAEGKSGVLS